MYTIPMRAQKSNSSWSNQPGTGLGPSLRVIQHTTRGERRRFIFSVGLFVFTLIGLVAGSMGDILQSASAVESPRWATAQPTTQPSSPQSQPSSTSPTTTQPSGSTQPSSTPQQPSSQPSSTPPSSTSSQPATQPPASSAPASSSVSSSSTTPVKKVTQPVQYDSTPVAQPTFEAAPIATPDTSGDIATMSAAQANVPTIPVTYTTGRISDATRNRLLLLAASALASGVIIYVISLFGASGSSLSYGNRTSEALTH